MPDAPTPSAARPARLRHPGVNREHPVRVWRVDDTRCVAFGVGRLFVYLAWPPRERPEPDGYAPVRNAVLRVEWRRT